MKKICAIPLMFFVFVGSQAYAQSQLQTANNQTTSKCGAGACIVANDAPGNSGNDYREPNAPSGQPTFDGDMQGGIHNQSDKSENLKTTKQNVLPEQKSDFEKFVADATGRDLPIFGQNLFLNRPADFAATTSIAAPSDYVVGAGDQIKVHTSGNVDIDVEARVDRGGNIFIPQVGSIEVAGLRQDQLEAVLQSAISKQFKDFNLSVALGQLRSIQVFVLGEARRPGVYTVSSLSTLINALFASGGPSDIGSLRDIQLKRNGEVISHLDVYDLIMRGSKRGDVHLLPGDIIYIPPVGPQVAIDGDITQPAIYELLGATTVEGLIKLAGGLTPLATTERASLNRIVDHEERTVQDFALTGTQNMIQVQGGDLVQIFPIPSKINQAVILRGNVGAPGRYAWHPGMRVSDLIPSRQFLITRQYYNVQNSFNPAPTARPFAATPRLNSQTGTKALSQDEAAAAVSTPNILTSSSRDELADHETEIDWNYAAIERLGANSLRPEIVPFVLGEAIDHPSSSENKLLEPGDVVIVYTENDLNLPSELRSRFVRIDGEVNRPGVYQLQDGETLRDLVRRAGGITPQGYLYASQLLRESVRIAEDRKLEDLIREESRDILAPNNQPTLTADGRTAASDLEVKRAYIQALSQIHSNGRITLRLSPDEGAEQLPEFSLQDGDHYFVPIKPNTVDVLGNVFNQGSFRYEAGAKVSGYLKLAGDRTRQADRSQEYLLRADGTVLSRMSSHSFDKLIVYPGDTVIVPARMRPGFSFTQLNGFGQVLSSFAIAALAIRSLN